MRKTIVAAACGLSFLVLPAAAVVASEGDAQSPTATTIDVGTTEVTRTSTETRVTTDVEKVDTDRDADDDDDSNAGLWGLLGLIGLLGLAGLAGLKRNRDDGYRPVAGTTITGDTTPRGASSSRND